MSNYFNFTADQKAKLKDVFIKAIAAIIFIILGMNLPK